MENPSTLLDSLVACMRAIPGLVALTVSSSNIVAFKRNYPTENNVNQAIAEMNPPGILVYHLRTVFGRAIDHQYSAIIRPRGNPDDYLVAMREGVPTGYGGVKFKRAMLNERCHPPLIQQYQPRFLGISETASIEVYELLISLTERGADT